MKQLDAWLKNAMELFTKVSLFTNGKSRGLMGKLTERLLKRHGDYSNDYSNDYKNGQSAVNFLSRDKFIKAVKKL